MACLLLPLLLQLLHLAHERLHFRWHGLAVLAVASGSPDHADRQHGQPPFEFVDWADRTIHVYGTFGVGGTVVLEGSNDGTNYVTLTDSNGVVPVRYQPYLIDPIGRSFEIELRKLF